MSRETSDEEEGKTHRSLTERQLPPLSILTPSNRKVSLLLVSLRSREERHTATRDERHLIALDLVHRTGIHPGLKRVAEKGQPSIRGGEGRARGRTCPDEPSPLVLNLPQR